MICCLLILNVNAYASTRVMSICTQLRVAARGAGAAFVKRIIRHWQANDEATVQCIEKLGWALACMLLYSSTHERMHGKNFSLDPTLARAVLSVLIFSVNRRNWWPRRNSSNL